MARRSAIAPRMLELDVFILFVMPTKRRFPSPTRYDLNRRSAGCRAVDMIDGGWILGVLGAVRSIDLLVDRRTILFHKRDIFIDAACLDVSFVAILHASEPSPIASVHRSDIERIADPDHPDDQGFAQYTVVPERSDLQLFCVPNPIQLSTCPCGHGFPFTGAAEL